MARWIDILGIITNVTSSRFTVFSDGKYHVLSARGVLKIRSKGIKVGDKVEFDENSVVKVFERKNYFPRINVANIDCVNIVVASVPKPDLMLVDKLIVEARASGAEVYITVNKSDIGGGSAEYFTENYRNAVENVFIVSAKEKTGFSALKAACKNKLVAFAGQSAVGKTSLSNVIFDMKERVDDVSEKTMRGRHTTTGRTIYIDDEYRIIDTPGFSAIDVLSVKSSSLSLYYKEFAPYNGKCYYIGCTHINEPDCLVKSALSSGKISRERYNRYCEIFKEIKEYEKRKY